MIDAKASLEELVERWNQEHRDLDTYMEGVRKWMYQVQQMGVSRFGEMAQSLRQLRERLLAHFDCEAELGKQLACVCESGTQEIEATKRQSIHDQEVLLARIAALIEPLSQQDPPFDTWQNAFQQMDLIMNELEQHEEQKGESLDSLCPKSTGS